MIAGYILFIFADENLLSPKLESLDTDPDSGSEDSKEVNTAIQNLLLSSFGDSLKYKHKNGVNSVRIEAVKSPYSFLYKTLGAVFLAVILGIICRYFVPENIYTALNDNILTSVRDMFMNALKIVIAPIVFFSMVNSVSQFNNFSEIGKMGVKFMTLFLFMEFTACILTALIFYASVFAGFPFSAILTSGEITAASSTAISIRNVIVNIVPSNFINPFVKSDILQLMFLGILCGLAVGAIGDYSKSLKDSFSALNSLFMKMTSMLTKFIPIAVLCSIWSMILTAGAKLLLSLISVIIIVLAGMVFILLIDIARLKLSGLSVSKFIAKYSPAMAHVLSTTSSVASLPENMKAADKMGVPSKVYSFSLPLGVIFSKNGSIFYRALTVLLAAKIFGVEISCSALISLLFSASVITLATPGVPGGAYIAFSALLAQLGVPSEALVCLISIDAVMDIFIAAINSFGTVVSAVTISHREGILNTEIYNS